ncbi:hypothetical protein ACFQ07_04130, partial [Actinomadura adrarensis]
SHLLDEPPAGLSARNKVLVQARKRLDLLRAMDFVPVISADPEDEASYAQWTDERAQRAREAEFKKPFPRAIGEGDKPIAFLIVKSMLLTGFDAPIEQVLYIDRSLKEAELLQAVARVNRTADGKKCGYVVDYYGVANHLAEALKAYAADEVDGVMHDLREEVAKLDPMRR